MATDGLWNRLTNDQAVNLLGKWLERNNPSIEAMPLPSPHVHDNDQLREDVRLQREAKTRGNPEPQKAYLREVTRAESKNFTVKDNNAATHLVRNALGGSNEDVLRGLLTVAPPYSRNLR